MDLQKHYIEKLAPQMMEELNIANKMAVPKVTKVVINIGLKEAITDKGVVEKVSGQLIEITGQKPKVTRAKKSIANFKLREGDIVGVTVTLRGKRMYDFMTKLFTLALPRVRDFQGVPVKFDQSGNYTLGLSEQTIFPEIDYSKIDKPRGLEITFVNTAGEAKAARLLLTLLGMPFKKD